MNNRRRFLKSACVAGIAAGIPSISFNIAMRPRPVITPNLGFVTILDRENRVVSNPGGKAPEYVDGELQILYQDKPLFKHCHDVCIDDDRNMYVLQWNAGGVYPYKLHRI